MATSYSSLVQPAHKTTGLDLTMQAYSNILDARSAAEARQARVVGRDIGLPGNTVEADLPGFTAERDNADTWGRLSSDPYLASFTADPHNAAAVKDDIAPISDLSALFKLKDPNAPPNTFINFMKRKQQGRNLLTAFDMAPPSTRYTFSNVPVPDYQHAPDIFEPGKVGQYQGGYHTLMTAGEETLRGGADFLADAIGKGQAFHDTGIYKSLSDQIAIDQMYANAPAQNSNWLSAQIYGATQSLEYMGLSLLTRAPVASMGIQQGLQQYGTVRARGGSANEALVSGGVTGAAESFFERYFGLGWMLGNFGKKATGKFIGGLLLREVPGEVATTAVQDLADAMVTGGGGWEGYKKEIGPDLLSTAAQTALMVGLMGGPHHLINRLSDQAQAAQQIQQAGAEGEFLDQLAATAEQSKTKKEDPQTLRDFIEQRTEATPARNVYVPVEHAVAYMQSDAYKGELDRYQPQIEQAQATQGDVVIPVSDAIAHLAGTPAWDALKDDMRVSPSGLSRNEAKQQNEEIMRVLEQRGKEIADEAQKSDTAVSDAAQVYDEVKNRLLSASVDERQADAMAQIYAARYEARASRLGGTAMEQFKRSKIVFPGEDAKAAGRQFAQDAVVNIGLNVPEGGSVKVDDAIKALKDQGVDVTHSEVRQSASEPTLVARLSKPLTAKQGHAVSTALKQEAIAQRTGRKGDLFGPAAEKWMPFDPAYFLEPTMKGELAAPRVPEQDALPEAGWTPERISGLIDAYGHEDGSSSAVAVVMSPDEYLGMLASEEGRRVIRERVQQMKDYGPLDLDKLRSSPPIVLRVRVGGEGNTRPPPMVQGHDGRHRMTMLKEAGFTRVPVVVQIADKNGQPAKVKDVTTIEGITPNRSRADQLSNGDLIGAIRGGVPISWKFKDQIDEGTQRALFQSPTAPIFYSALERAVQNSPQAKASGEQWAATLRKTPGVKQEELNWSGIEDFLKSTPGQITRDQLAELLAEGGIQVEEVVLGKPGEDILPAQLEARTQQLYDEYVEQQLDDNPDADEDAIRQEANGRWGQFEDVAANEIREQQPDSNAQFASWTSDPSNSSYRELLLTLPPGVRGNPARAPSTHWDVEGVVAHTRFMDKTDAEGKKVMFIEEVQSDWHQKGRDEGYSKPVDPKVLANAAKAEEEATAKANAAGLALMPYIREAVPNLEESETSPAFALAKVLEEHLHLLPAARQTAANIALSKWRALDLRYQEAVVAHNQAKRSEGIPEAPFKSSWPALVMKRIIRHAAENGYDRVAWTTGEEQADRYNLGSRVTEIASRQGTEPGTYRIRFPNNADVATGIQQQGMGRDDPAFARSVIMTEPQINEVFGHDLGGRLVAAAREDAFTTLEGEELRLGGEGMKAFYDRNLVNITNDIIKKYGAKVGRVTVPEREAVRSRDIELKRIFREMEMKRVAMHAVLDESFIQKHLPEKPDFREKAQKRHEELKAEWEQLSKQYEKLSNTPPSGTENPGFEVTDKMKEAALAGLPLFQRKGDEGPRGRTSISEDGTKIIELFGNADRSTLLHETGHIWLQELVDDFNSSDAPDQVKQDMETVGKWFAANGVPITKSGFIPTEAHELWARSVERYFMEGKAPSVGLRGVFSTFKSWLLRIYGVVQNLQAPITPDIREVFDRLIATDEAMADARRSNNTEPLFKSAEEAGMTDAEFADYQKRVGDARDEAYDALLYKTMEGIRRRRTAEMREARSAARDEAAREISSQPQFRLLHLLRTGKWLGEPDREPVKVKLNAGWLMDNYGEDIMDKLPRGLPITAADGETGDTIAEMVGMPSGEAVVHALVGMRAASDEIRKRGETRSLRDLMIDNAVDQHMADKFGDPLTDGSIEEEAVAAINTARQGEIIASEARQLGKRRSVLGVPTPYEFAREWARRTVAAGNVRDVASRAALQRYIRAANKAARTAETAILTGDIDGAYRAKQAQLLNHALLAEAKAAADRIDKIVARLKKLAGRAAMKSVDPEYLDKIHMMLEDYDFRPRTQRSIDEQESFQKWAERQRARGFEVHIPPRLENNGTPYTRVSVQELESLSDVVESLVALGRTKQKLLVAQKERDFGEMRDLMIAHLKQLPDRKLPDKPINEQASFASRFASDFVKVEKLAEEMDGGSTGPFNDMLTIGARDAENRRHELRHMVLNPIADQYHKIGKKHWNRLQEKVTIPELTWNTLNEGDPRQGQPVTITRSELLAIFMNMGNLSNLEKLSRGERWPVETLRKVMVRELTKDDYDLAQVMWDQVGKLWPSIVETERQMSGVVPEKVVDSPIDTPFGTYRGGYWPVVYDPARWQVAEDFEGKQLDDMFGIKSGVATQKGHTITRTGAFGPINLSLERVLFNHVEQVITRNSYAAFARDVLKVIHDRSIRGMIDTKLGPEYRKQIEPWLQQQVNAGLVNAKAARWWEKVLRQFRINMQIAAMGFRYTVLAAQAEGLFGSADRIGARWVGTGMKTYALHPIDTVRFVLTSSAEMRYRNEAVTRETAEMSARMRGKHSWFTTMQNFALAPIGVADRYTVSVPTWMGAYRKAASQGMTHDEAVAFADKNVRMSQGAGTPKDLSAVQARLGEGSRFFTMFYSPFNVMFNQQWAGVRAAKRGNPMPLIKTTFYWVVLTSLSDALLHGDWPKDWDAETIEKWFARNVFFGLWAGIPIARDLANWGNQTLGGQYAGDPGSTPVSRTLTSITKAITDAVKWEKKGQAPKAPIKEGANTAAVVAGLPISQAGAAAQFLWDEHSGAQDAKSVSDWYFGLTKGKVPDKAKSDAKETTL